MPQEISGLGLTPEEVRKAFAKKVKKAKTVSAYTAAGQAPKIKSNMLAEAGDTAQEALAGARERRAKSLDLQSGRLSQEATDRIARSFLTPDTREDTQTQKRQQDTSLAEGYMAAYDKARFAKLTFGDPEYNDEDRRLFQEAVRSEFGARGPSAEWLAERLKRVHKLAKERGETKLGSLDEALALPFGPTSLSKTTDEQRAQSNRDWVDAQKARIKAESALGGYADQPEDIVTPLDVAHKLGQGIYDASKFVSAKLVTSVDPTEDMATAMRHFDESALGNVAKAASDALPYFIPGLGQAAMVEGMLNGELAALESGNPMDFLTHSGMNPAEMVPVIMDPDAKLSDRISGAFGVVFLVLGATHGVKAIKEFREGKPEAMAAALQGVEEKFGPEVADTVTGLFDRNKFTQALQEEGARVPDEYAAQEPLKIVTKQGAKGERPKAGLEDPEAQIQRLFDRAKFLREDAGRKFGEGLRGNRENAVQEQSADQSLPREEVPQMGLRQVDEGNPQPEVTPERPAEGPEGLPKEVIQPEPETPVTAQAEAPAAEPKAKTEIPSEAKATWKTAEGDIEVTVTGIDRVQDGRVYVKTKEVPEGVPLDQLLRKPEDIVAENMKSAAPTGPDVVEPVKTKAEIAAEKADTAKAELASLWDEIKSDMGEGANLIGSLPIPSEAQWRAINRLPSLIAKAVEAGYKTSDAWVKHVVEQLGEWSRPYAQKVWDDTYNSKPETPDQKVESAKRSDVTDPETGLSNYVQEQEALSGIIGQVESTTGRTWQEFQKIGQDAVDKGLNYRQLASDVAEGRIEMTGQAVGILTAGKARMLTDIEHTKQLLEKDPGNPELLQKLDDQRFELDTYLAQIQSGKGRWSDTGRALQINRDMDWGDAEAVMAEARRNSKTGKISKKDADRIENSTKKVRDSRQDEAAAVSRLKEEQATQALKDAVKGKRSRVFNKAAITADLSEAVRMLRELQKTKGITGPKTRGAGAKITAQDIALSKERAVLIKRIAVNWIKLNTVVRLEDAVLGIQGFLRSSLNTDIERQAVIDALAHTDGSPTLSEVQKNLSNIRNEARQNSTAKKAEDALRNQLKFVESEAKRVKREYIADERKRALSELNAERQAAQEALNEINAAKKAEWRDMKDRQRAWERGERVRESAGRKEYRDWWNAQAAILEMKAKIENGEVTIPTKKQVETAQEILDIRAQRKVWESRTRAHVESLKTPLALRYARGVPNVVRGFFLGWDIGVLTRQGLFGLSRPKQFAKSFKYGIEAALSEENYKKWDEAMMNKRSSRDGSLLLIHRKNATLRTSDILSNPEEIVALRMMRNLGMKIADGALLGSFRERIGALPGALERFQSAFINSLRIETFDAAYEAGYTPAELQLRAKFINNATGRGNSKNAPHVLAQVLLTSPRYEASRWGMLGEPVRAGGHLVKDLVTLKRVNRAAYANVQDMVATAGLTLGLFKLMEGAGYEVDFDPTSSDFLKMRKGDEVWDVTAGIAPRLRDAMRLWALVTSGDPTYGENVYQMVGRTVGRAITPVIKAPLSQGVAWRQIENRGLGEFGQFLTGISTEDVKKSLKPTDVFTGFPMEDKDLGWQAYLPLIAQATADAWNKEGPLAGIFAGGREFIGGSVNRYPKRVPKEKAEPEKSPHEKAALTKAANKKAAHDKAIEEAFKRGRNQ